MLTEASTNEARTRASSGSIGGGDHKIKRVIRGGGGRAPVDSSSMKTTDTAEEGNIFTRFFFNNKMS